MQQSASKGLLFPPLFWKLVYLFPTLLIFRPSARYQKVHLLKQMKMDFIYLFFASDAGLNASKILKRSCSHLQKYVKDGMNLTYRVLIIVLISPFCMIGNVFTANYVRSRSRKSIALKENLMPTERDWNRKHEGWRISQLKVSFSSIIFSRNWFSLNKDIILLHGLLL